MRPPILRTEKDRSIQVGAPPVAIDYSPTGRADVNSYVGRVDKKIDLLNSLFVDWYRERWGNVPIDKQKLPTEDERSFLVNWKPFYVKWKGVLVWSQTPDFLFPPPPSEIWNKTVLFDLDYEKFRQAFAKLTKTTHVKAPEPTPGGTSEDEPGKKREGLFPKIPWTGILVVGGIVAAGFTINATTNLFRGSPTPEKK